jgi:hypothetical protein
MGRIDPSAVSMDLNVDIRLSRPTNSSGESYFELEITDSTSRLAIGEIKIPIESFANMMSTRIAEATMKYYKQENIGKKFEVKNVVLEDVDFDLEAILQRAKEWEEENSKYGWRITHHSKKNLSYRYIYTNRKYTVSAERWIQNPK